MTACGWILPPPQTRGNKVDPDQLKELVPGTSTKADVTSLIGSPTQKATFDENSWLYITEVTRPRIGRTLGVLDQDVVVLTFDDRGVLTGVKKYTKADAIPVVRGLAHHAFARHRSVVHAATGLAISAGSIRLAPVASPPAAARLTTGPAVSELRYCLALGRFLRQT